MPRLERPADTPMSRLMRGVRLALAPSLALAPVPETRALLALVPAPIRR